MIKPAMIWAALTLTCGFCFQAYAEKPDTVRIKIDNYNILFYADRVFCYGDSSKNCFRNNKNAVHRGFLAEITSIQGIRFQKDTEIYFSDRGKVYTGVLADAMQIENGKVKLNPGVNLYFHSNGKISQAFPVEPFELFGIKYPANTVLNYNAEGVLHQVFIRSSVEINGILFMKDSQLSLYKGGRMENGNLDTDTELNGILMQAKTEVGFYPDGKLKYGTAAGNVKINEMNVPKASRLFFYPTGRLEKIYLSEPVKFKQMSINNDREVLFHENGMLKSAVLAADFEFEPLFLSAGDQIETYDDGSVKAIKINRDMKIAGKQYLAGTLVVFSKEHKVKYYIANEIIYYQNRKYSIEPDEMLETSLDGSIIRIGKDSLSEREITE